jgi:hypothetical protein
MVQQLIDRAALFRILHEARIRKITELCGPLRSIDLRRRVVCDIKQHTFLCLIYVGRLSLSQLYHEYAEAPDIYLFIVSPLTSYHLWGHPTYRAHLALSIFILKRQLCRVAKISQFDRASRRDQHVVRLDVPVQDVAIM